MTCYLNRHSGLDRTCRVRFNLKLGDGEETVESGARDEVSDSDGKSYGWLPRVRFTDKIAKGSLRVVAEMCSVNVVRGGIGILRVLSLL